MDTEQLGLQPALMAVQPSPDLTLDLFDYDLLPELIAQTPAEPRDTARLLLVDATTQRCEHRLFSDLVDLLSPNDLLVANRTRVLPARLRGRRVPSGGAVEVLLLGRRGPTEWEALVRPGRRLQPGAEIELGRDGVCVRAKVGARLASGGRVLRLTDADSSDLLLTLGTAPLPPYIRDWQGDPERYQTVYGDRSGSAAAPTAGLHFTPELLERLRRQGIGLELVTLHVGVDTFRPIRAENIRDHELHAEWAEVPASVLAAIAATRARGGRVIAVGTTTVRALESVAEPASSGWSGETRLFITPGHRFRYVDALITNFHLPRSSLLVLVSAFAGRELMLSAYRAAVEARYRFYSFGDAMLIVR